MIGAIVFSLILGCVAGYCLKTMLMVTVTDLISDRCEALTSVGHGDRCDLPENHEGPHRCVCTNGIRLQDTFWWANLPRRSDPK